MNSSWTPGSEGSLVLSYLGVRRAIGVIGIALPFVLLIGGLVLDGVGVQSSISDVLLHVMGDVFVGSLCANGVFFLSYRYARVDSVLATADRSAGDRRRALPDRSGRSRPPPRVAIGAVHLVCATLYYLALACIPYLHLHQDRSGPAADRAEAAAQCRLSGQRHGHRGVSVADRGAEHSARHRRSTTCTRCSGSRPSPGWRSVLAWLIKGETLLRIVGAGERSRR